MKQILILLTLLIATTITSYAQAPQRFKYQAVARDANTQLIANQAIGVRFSIIEDQMNGTVTYAEVHYPITSDLGVFSVEVGYGISQTGSMSNVDWANHNYYMRVELDPQGGNAFQLMGVSQLLSVPYALHAETVSDKDDADADPANELQVISFDPNTNMITLTNGGQADLSSLAGGSSSDNQNLNLNGTMLSIEDGNAVDLSVVQDGVNDADANPSNELQNLSFNPVNNELTISNGNTITIPSGGTDADADPNNEIQTLSKSGSMVTLSNNGGSFIDENEDADSNPSNELQSLSFNSNTNQLTISNGNTITIPSGGTDADADPSNEIQTLSQNGLNVSLSNNGGTINVADNDNDGSNELQNLSFNPVNNELTISNGNSVTIPSGGTDADADPNNEIQSLSLSGTEISISNGNTIDVSVIQDGVDDADADAMNELQNLSLNGTEVTISDGNTIDLAPIIPPGGTDDQNLTLTGTSLEIEGGNTVDLSVIQDGVDDADADAMNELQNLSLNGTEVTISDGNTIDLAPIIPPGGTDDQNLTLTGTNLEIEGGNTVDLSVIQDGVDDADADPNNEIQTLSKSGSTVTLSNGGGTFTDEVDDLDSDPGNELQLLNLSGTNLTIDNGNTVDLISIQDGVDDADADPNNEIQTLSKSGSTVTLSNGGGDFTDEVDDADADASNELQDLSLSGTDLTIDNGNTVDLSVIQDGVDDADADPNNEIQSLSVSGNDLTISGGNSVSLSGIGGLWSESGSTIYYNTGKIGFGTDNPTYQYQFHNDVFVNSSFGGYYIGDPSSNQWSLATQNGGADLLFMSGPDGNTLTNRVTFKQDGRVGIGTNSPLADFHISGDYEVMRLDGTEPLIGFYDNGSYQGYVRKAVGSDFGLELGTPLGSDKGIDFVTNGSTRMAVSEHGKVGIGQSDPNNSLVVGDNWSVSYGFPAVMIGSSFGASLNVGAGDGNGLSIYQEGDWDLVYASTGVDEYLNLESKGLLVGSDIGTSTSGNYPLKISQSSNFGINLEHSGGVNNWEIYAASDGDLELYSDNGAFRGQFSGVDGAYTQASDRSLKTGIQQISSVLPSVLKLKPSSYKYIDNDPSDSRSIGLIAQDVQALFPELVNEVSSERTEETLLSVNYAAFSVVAIKAIQEQQEVIEKQADKIEDLESRLERLEAAIAKMN